MPYRGFTWNLTAGEAETIQDLMWRIVNDRPMLKVDHFLADKIYQKATLFLEVSPDGSTPSHAPADS